MLEMEFPMVQAHQVQEGCVEIMHGHNIMNGFVSKVVRRAMDVATAKAPAGDPERKAMAVVIASIFALRYR